MVVPWTSSLVPRPETARLASYVAMLVSTPSHMQDLVLAGMTCGGTLDKPHCKDDPPWSSYGWLPWTSHTVRLIYPGHATADPPWISHGRPTLDKLWKTYLGQAMEDLPWINYGRMYPATEDLPCTSGVENILPPSFQTFPFHSDQSLAGLK